MRKDDHRFRTTTAIALSAAALTGAAACGSTGSSGKEAAPQSEVAPLPASSSGRPAPSQAAVTKQLKALEKSRKDRIGAYAVDTGTGRFLAYRADERFPFASTFKVMACGAVLRKARRTDPGLMSRVIHYSKSDLVDYSPVTEKHVKTGMTVAALCKAAITQSDNTAGNLVLRQIGGPAGDTAFLRSLGDRVSRHDRWETDLNIWRPGELRDTTTPRAWAGDLRALTAGGALVRADRDRLIGWMKQTVTGDHRIRAGLPKGWTVGDKTGTGSTYGAANDIAIAWPPSGAPVIIVITTNRLTPDGTADEPAIAKTASILAKSVH
ncbi:class A beta-lactamase [Actinomadura sp. LD22]|uniref:Beta-lactamase n=1 Tax=Actinomadura physcomitrii TaxID=2650748 RepID=A0A6I4MH55_9ACTN|nr:class A beta-lactamase [Actinomadura physcomitrii]MWA04220.1 class A beta-lactamase [Actinomadura physcomitrii]